MIKLLCAVRDVRARGIIGIPMLFNHEAVATRWFSDLLADAQGIVHKHPTDYELVQYGFYDEELDDFGRIDPRVLLTGTDWKEMIDNAS